MHGRSDTCLEGGVPISRSCRALAGGRSSREFEGGNLDTQNTSQSANLFFVFVVQAICHLNVQKKMAIVNAQKMNKTQGLWLGKLYTYRSCHWHS